MVKYYQLSLTQCPPCNVLKNYIESNHKDVDYKYINLDNTKSLDIEARDLYEFMVSKNHRQVPYLIVKENDEVVYAGSSNPIHFKQLVNRFNTESIDFEEVNG